jgi:hypothetical protein
MQTKGLAGRRGPSGRAASRRRPAANMRGPLVLGAVVVILVIGYFVYDLLRPACDSIFEQTATRVSAKLQILRTPEELSIGREQVQALSDSSQKVALHLKACCVAQIDSHISPAQLQTCIAGAKDYEASVNQASDALQAARAAHAQGNDALAAEKTAQATQAAGAASGAAANLQKVAADVSSAPPPPASGAAPGSSAPGPALAPVAAQPGEVNLLAPTQGGQLLAAPQADWEKIISGNDADVIEAYVGNEAVFSFKDDKPAQFWKFSILIPASDGYNIKDFELLSGNDSITGNFESIGKFSTQNILLLRTPYQEFAFPKVTAKYFKLKVLAVHNSANLARLKQIRLFGSPT